MTETSGIDTTPTPDDATHTVCPRCAGTNGNHGEVHVRHGNGWGHNEPCPNTPTPDAAARAETAYDTGFNAGASWQRARISTRRDEALAAAWATYRQWLDDPSSRDLPDHIANAVLAALGVDR